MYELRRLLCLQRSSDVHVKNVIKHMHERCISRGFDRVPVYVLDVQFCNLELV